MTATRHTMLRCAMLCQIMLNENENRDEHKEFYVENPKGKHQGTLSVVNQSTK